MAIDINSLNKYKYKGKRVDISGVMVHIRNENLKDALGYLKNKGFEEKDAVDVIKEIMSLDSIKEIINEHKARIAEEEARKKAKEESEARARTQKAESIINNRKILLTSTPNLEGYRIVSYITFLSAEIVIPNGILGLMTSGTFFTISAMDEAKKRAIDLLESKAFETGANAVIGVDMDVNDLNNHGVMVSINGTAVLVTKDEKLSDETY